MLWVIGSLCQLHRKPFEPKLVVQQFPPPHDIAALNQAALALDFETRLHEINSVQADNTDFPCVAFIKEEDNTESPLITPMLVIRKDEERIMFFKAGEQTPQTDTLQDFSDQTLAVLCVGAWLVMATDSFTIGMLVVFQMFASRLSQPVLRMVGLWQVFQQANIAVNRLGDIMDAPAEPYSVSPSRAPGSEGGIEIQNLSFRYNEERPFLYRNFNLNVPPGHCVSVMGPSGSGKSTLTKLLQGFYLPTEGNILIDKRNILHLSANELREYFGVVPQETTLFSGSLYDNLIMANPTASFEQVIQACQMAEIHEQIEQMPQGYQIEIGENGVGLSGGQKQRIAIARAILKRPKILEFDEATSNLDQSTSEAFAKTISKLKGKVTILFITHQLPKGLKVDDAVILGKQQEQIRQDTIKDEGG